MTAGTIFSLLSVPFCRLLSRFFDDFSERGRPRVDRSASRPVMRPLRYQSRAGAMSHRSPCIEEALNRQGFDRRRRLSDINLPRERITRQRCEIMRRNYDVVGCSDGRVLGSSLCARFMRPFPACPFLLRRMRRAERCEIAKARVSLVARKRRARD